MVQPLVFYVLGQQTGLFLATEGTQEGFQSEFQQKDLSSLENQPLKDLKEKYRLPRIILGNRHVPPTS